MTDLAAALGVAQLRRVDAMRQRREEIAGDYNQGFSTVPAIELPPTPTEDGTLHSWHLYVIRLRLERLTIDRARFVEELKGRGIGTSVHFIPLHLHPYYRDTYGYALNFSQSKFLKI